MHCLRKIFQLIIHFFCFSYLSAKPINIFSIELLLLHFEICNINKKIIQLMEPTMFSIYDPSLAH